MSEPVWTDPDDVPEWTDEMFRRAARYQGHEMRVLTNAEGETWLVARAPGDVDFVSVERVA